MASLPLRPCKGTGCRELVESGFCPACQPLQPKRGNTLKGGYDWDWQKFRKWFLSQPEHCICEDCERAPSTEVHHVRKIADDPELRLAESNCRGLCQPCHAARTARGE